jgi:hypothetical protein
MKPIYVYVESTQSLAFQFVTFKTVVQAELFIQHLSERSQTLRSRIWHW